MTRWRVVWRQVVAGTDRLAAVSRGQRLGVHIRVDVSQRREVVGALEWPDLRSGHLARLYFSVPRVVVSVAVEVDEIVLLLLGQTEATMDSPYRLSRWSISIRFCRSKSSNILL